jgi:hypothetical protein
MNLDKIIKEQLDRLVEEKMQSNYMFFSNLEQIKRQCELLLELDQNMVNDLLNNGHDWADDHISSAKENIDQVFDFLMNEKEGKDAPDTVHEDEFGTVQETQFISMDLLNEAEYQGRKVQLGKIMQGDIKKFKVYVKNDKGKVVKVNFGFGGKSAHGKRMVIKKNNPERRKSFRARMKCDNPGPRWKPRYWACKTW